VNNVAVKNLHE